MNEPSATNETLNRALLCLHFNILLATPGFAESNVMSDVFPVQHCNYIGINFIFIRSLSELNPISKDSLLPLGLIRPKATAELASL